MTHHVHIHLVRMPNGATWHIAECRCGWWSYAPYRAALGGVVEAAHRHTHKEK